MTSYLAPESSRPSSVVSEYYFQQPSFVNGLSLINYDKQKCLFGDMYERELCFYLAKHTEANCDDRVCLIGEEAAWSIIIQERLFINKPICFIDCNSQPNVITKQLSTNKFDRIILFNCLHKINDILISPINLLHNFLASDGRLVIIYRQPSLNTLPLPVEVEPEWYDAHINNAKLIEQIYCEKRIPLDIDRKVENIKFVIQKLNWFSLLYNQMFYPLTLIDQQEIIRGLRQLNETYFKYHPDLVEIHEQILFVTVQKMIRKPVTRTPSLIQPTVNLMRRIRPRRLSDRMSYSQLSITDEVNQLLKLNEEKTKKQPFT